MSTIQISQQPNIGPFYELHATANWAKLRANLSFKSNENINDWRDLSAAQCFFDEFQARGV